MSIPMCSVSSRLQISSQGSLAFTKRQIRNYEDAYYIWISGLEVITKCKSNMNIEHIIWRDGKSTSLY
jgi:hypothetical protein